MIDELPPQLRALPIVLDDGVRTPVDHDRWRVTHGQ
jgi:hypothetical protein